MISRFKLQINRITARKSKSLVGIFSTSQTQRFGKKEIQ